MIVRKGGDFTDRLSSHYDPAFEIVLPLDDRLIPCRRLLLDALAVCREFPSRLCLSGNAVQRHTICRQRPCNTLLVPYPSLRQYGTSLQHQCLAPMVARLPAVDFLQRPARLSADHAEQRFGSGIPREWAVVSGRRAACGLFFRHRHGIFSKTCRRDAGTNSYASQATYIKASLALVCVALLPAHALTRQMTRHGALLTVHNLADSFTLIFDRQQCEVVSADGRTLDMHRKPRTHTPRKFKGRFT